MPQRNNINIDSRYPLLSPAELVKKYPLTATEGDQVFYSRKDLEKILRHKDRRHIMIVGPCSIHNTEEALEYAEKLNKLKEKVNDHIYIIMRVYFEKPRTTVGWKGLIYDPELNSTYNIKKGLHLARELMLKIVKKGLPVASEILDPVITQYLADLISWAAIGARTTESQTHRQLVSGLSMPTGFKNTTDGSIKVAIEAIKTANSKHSFIGVLEDGRTGVFRTKGNKYAHLVLRGGNNNPNYGSEYIAFTRELMKKNGITPNIIVDCSHANSSKQAEKQKEVFKDIIGQIIRGEKSIVGTMIESNIKTGSQKVVPGSKLQKGISLTDACLGWEETEEMILEANDLLKK